MANTEERDVPELVDLLSEIENKMADLDARPAGSVDALSEIKGTILPLLKDVVASTILAHDDILDQVDPIKLGRADADEIGTLLGALRSMSEANPELVSRIDDVLPLLAPEGEDIDDGGGDSDGS